MTALPLHFVEEGDGPPALLLHGFPEFHRSWRKQIPALSGAGIRVLAPDLRGYALSPRPRGIDAYRLPELVGDVAALIEQDGPPCDVVGHDWGGIIAWYLAMSRPGLVRRLVILNTPHPSAYTRMLHLSTRQKLRSWYQAFFLLPLLPELAMRVLGRRLMRGMARFTEAELDEYQRAWRGAMHTMLNYYRALPRSRAAMKTMSAPLSMPVMLIWGEREPVFLPETVALTQELVPQIRVERIADAGHFVQTDAPDRVNELLLDFLG